MNPAGASATWRVPGRIEVLGKHTDYAGGNVLVCAATQAVTATATARSSARARPTGAESPPSERREPARYLMARSTAFPGVLSITDGVPPLPAGHWGRYVATAWQRLRANFGDLPDADLTFTSDLPPASGMSSSSAVVVAAALALADLAGLPDTELWASELGEDRLRWASYLAAMENGLTYGRLTGSAGVGTRGGSEDHTGMLCSRPGRLGQFGFDPVARHRHVALPPDHVFVIAVSGVSAEKTGPALVQYNGASDAVAAALAAWNAHTGRADRSLAAAVRADAAAPGTLRRVAEGAGLRDRVEHFRRESEVLVPAGADALAAGDLAAFGAVADDSQHLAETLLGNQVPQTVALAATARELGADAASGFGAGFGGSVWALVPRADAQGFASAWLERHTRAFPAQAASASALVTDAATPAQHVRPTPPRTGNRGASVKT